VAICYRCKKDLEPTIIPNWFIRVRDLKQPVIKAIKKERIKFFPARFKKQILRWMEQMRDWPISRQIVWGIRIPAWYNVWENPDLLVIFLDRSGKSVYGKISDLLRKFSLSEITSGLQKLMAPKRAKYIISKIKPKGNYLQETDTFDTWFSSGQWPLVTLKDDEYKTRFPTDLMGTLQDILPLWVSRMIMFSLYIKRQIPFKTVYLWPMVADAKGKKMSKSKGNVVNPIELVDKYGADAFRTSLFFGVSPGGKVNLSEEKIIGMRNFANKVWNISRFIYMNLQVQSSKFKVQSYNSKLKTIKQLTEEFKKEKKKYFKYMDGYQFSKALGLVYKFLWHRFADYYIEELKDEIRNGNIKTLESLKEIYLQNLVFLHPFMPFITEAVWKVFNGEKSSILVEKL